MRRSIFFHWMHPPTHLWYNHPTIANKVSCKTSRNLCWEPVSDSPYVHKRVIQRWHSVPYLCEVP